MEILVSAMPHLIHLGALLYFVCFLFRDQVWLRCFAILGDICYVLFYLGIPGETLWSAIFYSGLNMAINIIMISMVVNDRRQTKLSDDEMRLYQGFAGMTPGDFRRLAKIGSWKRVTEKDVITEEGKSLDQLYYVLEGEIDIQKGNRNFPVPAGVFIGEVAYLKQMPASATVTLKPGALCMSWPHEALRTAVEKHDGLKQSLSLLLSADLATKVARS